MARIESGMASLFLGDCIGDLYKGRGPDKPRRLKLVSVLKARALTGKGPFEALAHGGYGISHPQRR